VRPGEHHRALGDVGRIVADPLDVRGNAQSAVDLAQVAGHRLAQRQQPQHVLADFVFEDIDRLVVGDHPLGRLAVAADHDVDGCIELRHGDLAHAGDLAVKAFELGVEALDDVFVFRGHDRSLAGV
jgi:hypothetical protein